MGSVNSINEVLNNQQKHIEVYNWLYYYTYIYTILFQSTFICNFSKSVKWQSEIKNVKYL